MVLRRNTSSATGKTRFESSSNDATSTARRLTRKISPSDDKRTNEQCHLYRQCLSFNRRLRLMISKEKNCRHRKPINRTLFCRGIQTTGDNTTRRYTLPPNVSPIMVSWYLVPLILSAISFSFAISSSVSFTWKAAMFSSSLVTLLVPGIGKTSSPCA